MGLSPRARGRYALTPRVGGNYPQLKAFLLQRNCDRSRAPVQCARFFRGLAVLEPRGDPEDFHEMLDRGARVFCEAASGGRMEAVFF